MTGGPGRFGQPELPDRPPPAGLFTRGYDRAGTDELVAELLAQLQQRSARLSTVERENRRLRAERDAERHAERVHQVEGSIGVLSSAQQDAERIMAEADAYRERAAAESERMRAEARHAADAVLAAAHARSQDVDRREQQARLTQEELLRQTQYLRSVREAAGTQVLRFLNGIVDHVAEEFGAALPAAATDSAVTDSAVIDSAVIDSAVTTGAGPTAAPAVSIPPTGRSGRAFPQLPMVAAAPRARAPRVRREPRGHVRRLAGRW